MARTPAQAGRPSPASCAAVATQTLEAIGQRIYAQAQTGRNVVAARRRLARSRALPAAVARDDAAGVRAALAPLLRDQIRRIVVTRGERVLAALGRGAALAPVRGVIRDAAGRPVGRYVLSVADRSAMAGVIAATTGARVTVARTAAAGATFVVPAAAFPTGPLAISITLPGGPPRACGATPAATLAATDRAVARRLYATEARGPAARRVLRYVAGDAGLRDAVAHHDAHALRAAIIRFFRTPSLHVVRIRATTAAGRLIGDVGGPYVLAPATAPVRDAGGRVIGHVTVSVQDDTGYIKLLHRFTGADVQLRTPGGLVPGSARAAPAGAARVAFTVRAFPAGPLRVALFA